MLIAIKDLFSSKKFWLTILGSAVVAGLNYVHAPMEMIGIIGGLFGVNIVGQGMADLKKNTPQ